MVKKRYLESETDRLTVIKYGEVEPVKLEKYSRNNPYYKNTQRSTAPQEPTRIPDRLPANQSGPFPDVITPPAAINRLVGKVNEVLQGPKGELLTSAVEWKSSLDMITKRAGTLIEAYSALRKGHLFEVAKILGIPNKTAQQVVRRSRKKLKWSLRAPPKERGKKKPVERYASPTSAWLEYWMGWAPLMGDIGHALNTLVRTPPPNNHFSVGVRVTVPTVVVEQGSPLSHYYFRKQTDSTGVLSAYGNFIVTNHNLNLLNQLGFVNPALTMWQIVPFSFIVDWFGNVGQVIGSLTDNVGITLSETGSARMMKTTVTTLDVGYEIFYDPSFRQEFYSLSQSGERLELRRDPGGLPKPQLNFAMLDKLSLSRAATSISLLVEIFLRK